MRGPRGRPGLAHRQGQPTSYRDAPLPWLPDIPNVLRQDGRTSHYLDRLTHRIDDLKQRVADEASQDVVSDRTQCWLTLPPVVDDRLISDLTVWRAAHGVPATDNELTGPPLHEAHLARHQARLKHRLMTALAAVASPPQRDRS